jgi:phospholipase/carboxylesterase
MNRLSPALSPQSSITTQTRDHRPPSRAAARAAQPQCLLVPQHYEPNYSYPLLVWLHDAGGSERELHTIMRLVSLRNYVSLSVRGTRPLARGFGWEETADALFAAQTSVAEAVAQARQRFNVHPRRIFLAGAGQGGTLAMRLALRSPELFAGAASLGGKFPRGHAPLARLDAARQSRLLVMHCRDSQTYTVEHVCGELSLYHAAGMSVTLRQYPCGDELTTQMLHDLDVWLMEQVTGTRSDELHESALPSDWN